MNGDHEARREELLDRIAEDARACRGSMSNPRYFAEMLVGGLASNAADELEALEVVDEAVREVARRQRRSRALEAAEWAMTPASAGARSLRASRCCVSAS
jgi:hypothetical protein